MKIRIILSVCMLVLVLAGLGSYSNPVAAAGNTYYVATNGSDSNPGTLAKPWLTPQHAANTMVAGDTCYIEAGTYGLSGNGQRIVTEHNGAPGAPITFQNYNGGTITIFSSGLYCNLAIQNSYNDFIGLNCVGDAKCFAGADIEGDIISNILIQNCSFSNFEVGGIYMDETASRSDITVTGCTFNGTNTTSNMEIVSFRDVNGFTISNNLVENPAYANRCGICTAGCSNGSIYNNTVYNTSSYGIYVGPSPQNAGSNVNVYDNLVYNCQNAGLAWADEVGYGDTSTAINFYNNIVYGNYRGFELDQNNGNFTVNFSLINNIFYHNGGSAGQDILVAASNSELSNCIIRNNIIDEASDDEYAIGYNNYKNGGITVDHNLYYNSGGAWSPSNVFGTNYVTGNPLLTSPTTNFSLQSGSPAIGAGSSANAPATDYIGVIRTSPPCIGAYEYTSSALSVSQNSLTNGVVGTAYSQTLSATGGTPPYTWTLTSGILPAGLSLSSSGVIAGTPTTAGGPTSITFQVTDTNNLNATKSLSITVAYSPWDVNQDGTVNVLDLTLITKDFGETGTPGWVREDVHADGIVNKI